MDAKCGDFIGSFEFVIPSPILHPIIRVTPWSKTKGWTNHACETKTRRRKLRLLLTDLSRGTWREPRLRTRACGRGRLSCATSSWACPSPWRASSCPSSSSFRRRFSPLSSLTRPVLLLSSVSSPRLSFTSYCRARSMKPPTSSCLWVCFRWILLGGAYSLLLQAMKKDSWD